MGRRKRPNFVKLIVMDRLCESIQEITPFHKPAYTERRRRKKLMRNRAGERQNSLSLSDILIEHNIDYESSQKSGVSTHVFRHADVLEMALLDPDGRALVDVVGKNSA